MNYSRREFVKQGANALIVGLTLRNSALQVFAVEENVTRGVLPSPRSVSPNELDSWLAISSEGNVTVYTGRVDLGTGVQTSFAQVVADELDVPFEAVTMVMGDTALTTDGGKSTASSNSNRGQQPLIRAAAEARRVLLAQAANRLGAPVETLSVQDGIVSVQGNPSKKISYAEIIGNKRFNTRLKASIPPDNRGTMLEGTAPIKTGNFKLVGKSIPRVDVPEKVAGTWPYVHNVRIPGMVHGRVVFPSAPGATLITIDEDSVRGVPGVIKVVRKGNFVGVVAEREEQAIQAARQLRVTWSEGTRLPRDKHEWLRNAKKIKTEDTSRGDVVAGLAKAVKTIRATYKTPIQNHGMIGPSCAVADVRDGQATFWSGSQWIQGNRRDLAAMLGLPLEKVRGVWLEASGSYGRLACDDAAPQAALLSQAVGRPVRVQWMRQDEHAWAPMSPPTLADMQAGLDAQGKITAFVLEGWSPSHSSGESGNSVAWRLVGGNPGHTRLSGGLGGHAYDFENDRTTMHYVEELLRAIYMRGPGSYQTCFAIETFMDELAAAANADPVEFRLRHLKDPDSIAVIEAVAKNSGWQTAPPYSKKISNRRGTATGRGISNATTGRKAAVVADVEVNLETGKVRVTKAVIAVTCGRIINPEGMRHQLQGGLIQGLSRSLMEEIKLDQTRVTDSDWLSYPILRFPEIPEIETILIDRPDSEPDGVGETASIPAAAAIGNAIFDATGVRLREVPFTPFRLRQQQLERQR
ncbi:MAG: xanthine dehydrogenase family protein molybdopterin-binding subunit [Acidobacteria bacterium]|nr:MAG: xanthine dehydrogenase family protein molybdopterin-binding subunit [Acidobacteriota bacterium]